jgi:eukaryotic-like serine/threonine-protein kinase
MSYCVNPNCPKPENTGKPLYCQTCGSELLLHGRYRVTRVLGGGGFGKTYEVDDSGLPKVLKILVNTLPKAIELFQQEGSVLSRLQHPGIPKVEPDGYFTYLSRESQQPLHCLVMEKIEGMNLDEYMQQRSYQPIAELVAINWLKQLVQILHQVHQQQYFHRDIKPANIMLRNPSFVHGGQLVLIDFGTAREVTQTFMQKLAGQQVTGIVSVGYSPPEQMNGKAVPQSDFFALGRTFIFLLTGKSPNSFPEDSRTGELIWRDYAPQVSQQVGNLIDYLVAPFPGNRPKDTYQIMDCLAAIDKNFANPPDISYPSRNQTAPDNNKLSKLSYAGFWKRSLAYLIDYVIIVVGAMLISAILGSILINLFPQLATLPDSIPKEKLSSPDSDAMLGGFFTSTCGLLGLLIVFVASDPPSYPVAKVTGIIIIILQWLYFVCLESSSLQATIGKMPLRIIATDANGNRLTFGQANIRYWSKTVSALLLFIGYIVAIFTKKKQALHDMIANSLIINK